MSLNQPTFAKRVKGSLKPNSNRPNGGSLKTKSSLRRHEVTELIKEIKFENRKLLVGVAEIKSRSIDITCKTRQDVLDLCKKLKEVNIVYHVWICEFDHVNVILGWAPIVLPDV